MIKSTVFLLFLSYSHYLYSQKVQWATSVLGFSSEFIYDKYPGQYLVKEILGEPSGMPNVGSNPCAWASKNPNSDEGEWVAVGFSLPQKVSTVYISENFNAGAIYTVSLKDINGNYHLIYQNDSIKPYTEDKGRLFTIKIPKTTYQVNGLKVELKTGLVSGHNQLDAIGISEDVKEYIVKINQDENSVKQELTIENLGSAINSIYKELAPVIAPDGETIYYTRQSHPENLDKEAQDVWVSTKKDGQFSKAIPLGSPINNKSNNSVLAVTPDGQTLLLNNIYYKDGNMAKGVSFTHQTPEGWSFPEEVVIDSFYNNNMYGEYSLSNSKNIIIMAIERKDSKGSKDLYVSFKKEDSGWSAPKSLGDIVNTASSEISPFLASDNKTLYFATAGFPGYGSSDIFMTKRLDDTWLNWTKPLNLGPNLNSKEFDAYYTLPASGECVYFVSYKKDGLGEGDIYKATLPKELRPEAVALVRGKVLHAKDSTPISTDVIYHNLKENIVLGSALSDPKEGKYQIALPVGVLYGFSANKDGFLPISENLDLTKVKDYEVIEKDLYLVPIEKDASFTLNNIYFETDKYDLKMESFTELNGLIKILKQNTSIKIEIEGHTDNVGDDNHNLTLSNKRAKTVTDYLTNNGIDASRLLSKGFGEKKPIAPNDTPENKQKNRRVVFRITDV